MFLIKKVSVTPLPENEASVIDSYDTTDDAKSNTLSIRVIKQKITELINSIGGKANSSHTHTKSQITDFNHTHDDRYYTETESDARYKLKGDFAVITTNVTTPSAGSEIINVVSDINYPAGFTLDNCVIVSLMAWNQAFTSKIWSTVGVTGSASEMGYYGLRGRLWSDKIEVQVHKIDTAESAKTITIKVVLMKVS